MTVLDIFTEFKSQFDHNPVARHNDGSVSALFNNKGTALEEPFAKMVSILQRNGFARTQAHILGTASCFRYKRGTDAVTFWIFDGDTVQVIAH